VAEGLLCILLCQWLLAIHLKKVTSGGGSDFSEWSTTQAFLQLVATTCVLLELMILWTLETIFWIEREEGKKEGMLITTF